MTVDFGSDVSAVPSLDPVFSVIAGPTSLIQDCVKRLSCPFLFYAPGATMDLRLSLSAKMTDQQVFALKGQIEHVIGQDERVESATAALTFTPATSTLAVALSITTAAGPFVLVLSVTPATVALVTVNRPVGT